MKKSREILLMQEALGLIPTGMRSRQFDKSLDIWRLEKGIKSEEELQSSMYFSVQKNAVYIDTKKTNTKPSEHQSSENGLCGLIIYTSQDELPEDFGNIDPIVVEDRRLTGREWADLSTKIRRNFGMFIIIDSKNIREIKSTHFGALFNSINVPDEWRGFYAIKNGDTVDIFREY